MTYFLNQGAYRFLDPNFKIFSHNNNFSLFGLKVLKYMINRNLERKLSEPIFSLDVLQT